MPPALPAMDDGFHLLDHHGQRVSGRSYRGRPALILFGFSHCRVVCPRALAKLSAALKSLGVDPAGVQVLYVTVDPDRDTPERLKAFLAPWPRVVGLTGDMAEINAVKAAFRVFASRRDTNDGYDVPHTAFTYLLDASGRYVDHWPEALSTAEVADRIVAGLV